MLSAALEQIGEAVGIDRLHEMLVEARFERPRRSSTRP